VFSAGSPRDEIIVVFVRFVRLRFYHCLMDYGLQPDAALMPIGSRLAVTNSCASTSSKRWSVEMLMALGGFEIAIHQLGELPAHGLHRFTRLIPRDA
jgi:hypothetical protein